MSGSARGSSLSVLTDLLYAEPLLARDWEGRILPRTARAWSWEDDGTTLRVELKEGVLFHDGTPLTAGLIARQLEDRLAKAPQSAAAGFQSVTSISAPSPTSLIFRVTQPDILLLAMLSDLKIVHPDAPNLSTGPFTLIQREPTVKVERFERYHGGSTRLAAIEIVPFDTQRGAWAALLRGQVDAVQEIDRDAVEFLAGNSRVRTYSALQPFYVPLVLNVRHPILARVEVRRAIAEAINRDEIISRVLRGKAIPAAGPVWPLHWAYSAASQQSEHAPERARDRLDRAGYLAPPLGSKAEPQGRFTIKCLVWGESPLYERLALVIQRQLFAIDVNLEIEFLPLAAAGMRVAKGDFDAFILPTNAGRTLERMYRLWRSRSPENPSPTQDSGYTGADDLLDELRRATSEEQTRAIVDTLVSRFREDVPAVFIAWLDVTRAVDARFDVGEAGTRDPLGAIWQWRPVETETR